LQPRIVLCMDDDESLLLLLDATLSMNGYAVLTATNGRQALKLAHAHELNAAVLDYNIPEMDGGEVACEIKRIRPSTPVVMFSGTDIPLSALMHADGLVRKGESVNALLGLLHRLLHRDGPEPLAPRRFPRFPLQLPLSVVIERSGQLAILQGTSTTVGEGGLGGTIDGSLVPGEKVLLHISRQTGVVLETRRAQVCYRKDDSYGFAFLDTPLGSKPACLSCVSN
jgi:CheY-like chemotaxis protein